VLVYQILLRYWAWTPEEDVKPRIFLMSDNTLSTAHPPADG
jgi:hypothetical protein